MRIGGRCHCGNLKLVLEWPGELSSIGVRACGCDFCTKHAASWTSHRNARLTVHVAQPGLLAKYRFGTGTADFLVCARCGVVVAAASLIDDRMYAVVNVNAFEDIDVTALERAVTHFDGEGTGERLDRRKRNWIPDVRILHDQA